MLQLFRRMKRGVSARRISQLATGVAMSIALTTGHANAQTEGGPPSRFDQSVFLGELSESYLLDGVTGLGYFVNSIGGASTTALISPDRILGAAHYAHNLRNRDIWFFDQDGNAHLRRVTETQIVRKNGADTDIVVGMLDEPLPETVQPLKMASTAIMGSLSVSTGADWGAGPVQLARRFPSDTNPQFIAWIGLSGAETYSRAVTGDSGSPILAPSAEGGEWCVIGTHSYSSIFSNVAWVHREITQSAPTARFTSPCPDLNADGHSNVFDLISFLRAFSAGSTSVDFDSNGHIDSMDFISFLAFYGGC